MTVSAAAVPPQMHLVFPTDAKAVAESTRSLIERSREEIDRIVADNTPQTATFESVVLPLARCRDSFASEARVIEFLKDVSAEHTLREESQKSKSHLDHFSLEVGMRKDLYLLVNAVSERTEDIEPNSRTERLDFESRRLLRFEHGNFLKNGLGVPIGSSHDRFKDLRMRLSNVTNDYRRNMIEEAGAVVFSPADLAGLPDDFLQGLTARDPSEHYGLNVTFKMNHFYPLLRYAESGETRRRYFVAYENRCERNVSLFQEAVLLRDEIARLLGKASHAELRTGELMAKHPSNVQTFLHDLKSQLQPRSRAELKILRELKERYLGERGIASDGKFYIWDFPFYHRLMLETQYSVNHAEIAEYFPLQTVVPAMLELFGRIFGLAFHTNLDSTSQSGAVGGGLVWHGDVQVFDVWDSTDLGGDFLGYMYLDLFARDHKYKGLANFNLQPGNKTGTLTLLQGYLNPDGTRHFPSTALVCNFDAPRPERPSLLKHSEVCMLFHELGHGIHDIVAKTKYSQFHGTACADDFCEAPSQMLERWCWSAATLKLLSQHYSTISPEYSTHWKAKQNATVSPPRQLPEHVLKALLQCERLNAALANLKSLHRAVFDMRVHAPPDRASLERMNLTREFNLLQQEIVGLDTPPDLEWGHGQAQFSHLVEGYDAGFYGYLYSKIFASDLYSTAFEPNPTDREVAIRYRQCVLEKGGSEDEMAVLTAFLGRPPNSDAFKKELGITGRT